MQRKMKIGNYIFQLGCPDCAIRYSVLGTRYFVPCDRCYRLSISNCKLAKEIRDDKAHTREG